MSEQDTETLLNLEDLLNASMDDIEEAAGFVTPSDGTYQLAVNSCKIEKYKAKDESGVTKEKHRIKFIYQVLQCLEKANAEDPDTPVNGLFSEVFQLNETGLKYFKTRANGILSTTEGLNLGESIKAINDSCAVVKATTKIKETPKKDAEGHDTGKNYLNVQVRVIELSPDIPFPEQKVANTSV